MSSEKNPEVAGCGASIMKNVWEIRVREHRQKLQLEQERTEKSALPSINQVWANRVAGKLGSYKRVERKTKRAESQADSNIWKSKHTQIPPALPRSVGSGLLNRKEGQSSRFSTQSPNYKDKKGHQRSRLQLLIFISQTQPSAMVWGKSWKYNKSLPPGESTTSSLDWGECWMFNTQQPYTEEGKPWPNGPNMIDPQSLHLWKKRDCRLMESQEVESSLPTEEWKLSWRKSDKNSKEVNPPAVNGENHPKSGLFTLLVERQHHNENLCSSEWSESWRATKPASQQEHFTIPNSDLIIESAANKQDKDRNVSSRWEECWRLVNYHGYNKPKFPQVKKSHSPEWANSWITAVGAFNNHKNSAPSPSQDDNDTYEYGSQTTDSDLHEIMCHDKRYRDLQLCNELMGLPEWTKSLLMTKNNSKPSEEIEKVLNALPPGIETLKVEENTNEHYLVLEKANVKHNVIYQSSHDKLSLTQWSNAWKWSIKHWTEQVSRENWVNELLDIHPLKGKFSFDNQMSKERYPEKDWSASWKAGTLVNHQLSQNKSSGIPGKNTTQQQHATGTEHGSKWGRSFRLANPMPHTEKPWVESSPNPCHYKVLWSVGKNILQNKIITNSGNNPATLRFWGTSHQFLQGADFQTKDTEPTDPRVIILPKKIKTRKHLYSHIEKEKQSEKKWAGCHLLGKTQPGPKRRPASVQKLKMEDESEDKFFEEWVESWRLFVCLDSLIKQKHKKSLLGWTESWKFLLPLHQPINSPKAK